MKATQQLNELGQSLWLDNITRDLLDSGTLKRYIGDLAVTGLTSNPTIFDHAIAHSSWYDTEIRQLIGRGLSGEDLFFELAIEDLTRAADLFRPIHERTGTVDGWVSLEVSPLLAYDTKATVAAAKTLYKKANRPNLFIKIPGTKEGAPAIEEAIFSGITVNVTLLFSRDHYVAAADAYMRGLERRVAAGLSPDVRSVASLFISRWDKATMDKVPAKLRDNSAWQSASRPTRPTATCSNRTAGSGWRITAPALNDCFSPVRGPRTPKLPTSFILARWPLPTRSTPCPRRPCWRSASTARSPAPFRATARIAKRCWRTSAGPELKSASWAPTCKARAPSLSSIPGRIC